MRWAAIAAVLVAAPIAAAVQVPPPPSLPGQDALAQRIVRAVEGKDLPAYAALLADDVSVSEDGREIARGKAQWLARFGPKLTAPGVLFRLDPGYSATGRVMFVEYVSTVASWGGDVPAHCCWQYDAVAYDLDGAHVTRIRRLRGGDQRLGPDGAPTR